MPKLEPKWIRDGVFYPDWVTSSIERQLFHKMEVLLEQAGFQYLSVPSLVTKETYDRQAVIPWEKVFKVDDNFALAGSAEQGILEMFTNRKAAPAKYWAKNQCFRAESSYEGYKRLREFIKLEQFIFCKKEDWEESFDLIMSLACTLLDRLTIEYRVVDVTKRDPGYHILKKDIEVKTETYGWMETHSCSYFGEEQTKRFNISGGLHTLSNTGIASPRILVPILERITE